MDLENRTETEMEAELQILLPDGATVAQGESLEVLPENANGLPLPILAQNGNPAENSLQETEQRIEQLKKYRQEDALAQYRRNQLEQLLQAYPDCGVQLDALPPELGEKWARNGSLLDAWRLLHFEEICKSGAEAARQRTVNEMREKRRLSLAGAQGAQGAQVSESDLTMLRKMLPGKPDRELRSMLLKVRK